MDISKFKVFNLMQTNMNYLGAKQDVLSQNVANANTPNYDAKTLKPIDFNKILNGGANSAVKPAATSPKHISTSASGAEAKHDAQNAREIYEITPTGNKVVLAQEIMQMTKNNMEYQQTTNIYRKMLQMMKIALGENV